MANGVLSSYFEKEKAKGTKAPGLSLYSAPVDAASAPAGGASAGGGGGGAAPSAPAAAPKGSAGGGTGFVSFGQYFGANAPAVQAQAQKTVEQAKGAAPSGMGQFVGARPSLTGQSVGSMARQLTQSKQTDPFARQIAQAEKQSAGLEQAARYGDMGEGTSAFDQLLGGGVTQRAAKQEQQRLGTLRAALEGEQAQYRQEQERRIKARERDAQRQAEAQAKQKQLEESTLQLAKRKALEDSYASGKSRVSRSEEQWWNLLSPEEQQQYIDASTYSDDSEYASVSQ